MRNVSNEEINYLTGEVQRLKAELEEHNADNCPWRLEVRRLRTELEGAQNRALLMTQKIYHARAEEREACAKLVEEDLWGLAKNICTGIRARGEKK